MKKTLWPHNIIFIIGVLFSFSHAQIPTDLTNGMLRNLIDKMEELKTDVTQMKESLANIQSESNSEMIQMRDAITSMKEEAKLRDESLKEDISNLKQQGCESQLESLSTTLVDFFTHNETQIGKPQELLPADCQAVLHSGRRQSGVYKIFPVGMPGGVNVYCDQESDGGGWIVFLQRQQQTPQVDFVRPFEDYAKGFGEPGREIWLGNRILHTITRTSNYELRAEGTNVEGDSRFASWGTFRVGSENTQFTVTVTDYRSTSSNLGDGMTREGREGDQSNQMKFSTYDKDHRGCSSWYGRVGWWFDNCGGGIPTAAVIGESSSPRGLSWFFWEKNSTWGWTYLSSVQMKIRAQ